MCDTVSLMVEDIHYEVQQAREEFAKLGPSTGINIGLARKYLLAAIAARDGNVRMEWESLFGFWRTIIQGGWRCPDCGGQMVHGEASGVRCKKCRWVPGIPG
jgi:hypothetical protein